MVDFEGKELNIGDEVVFIYNGGTSKRLMKGTIENIKNGCAYIEGICYNAGTLPPRKISQKSSWYDDQVKVKSQSIFKICKQ